MILMTLHKKLLKLLKANIFCLFKRNLYTICYNQPLPLFGEGFLFFASFYDALRLILTRFAPSGLIAAPITNKILFALARVRCAHHSEGRGISPDVQSHAFECLELVYFSKPNKILFPALDAGYFAFFIISLF